MARAVVAPTYGGPEVLTLVEVDPGPPGNDEVLLEVRAAGVNPADWKTYGGMFGRDPGSLPLRLGFEAAGVVLAAGAGARQAGVEVGAEVIAHPVTGAYADRLLVPFTSVVPKPPALNWPEAGATTARVMVRSWRSRRPGGPDRARGCRPGSRSW